MQYPGRIAIPGTYPGPAGTIRLDMPRGHLSYHTPPHRPAWGILTPSCTAWQEAGSATVRAARSAPRGPHSKVAARRPLGLPPSRSHRSSARFNPTATGAAVTESRRSRRDKAEYHRQETVPPSSESPASHAASLVAIAPGIATVAAGPCLPRACCSPSDWIVRGTWAPGRAYRARPGGLAGWVLPGDHAVEYRAVLRDCDHDRHRANDHWHRLERGRRRLATDPNCPCSWLSRPATPRLSRSGPGRSSRTAAPHWRCGSVKPGLSTARRTRGVRPRPPRTHFVGNLADGARWCQSSEGHNPNLNRNDIRSVHALGTQSNAG